MRMKEDHMLNGQLKPGYNVQIGCENGFVVGYDIFPNPTDTKTLKPHLERMEERFGKSPERVIADAGYGSEENYVFLKSKKIEGIVKYPMWQKEQKRSWKKSTWNTDNWKFDETRDEYECPAGKALTYAHSARPKTETGFTQEVRVYECSDCDGCEFRLKCTKSKYGRTIQRNERMRALKKSVKEHLSSVEGKALMRRRAHEVETVFGQLKANQGFRRFRLRGTEKVSVEWGLLVLGYNFKQLARL
jgi:RNase P protein component